jgi:hypothetical protein
MEKGTYYLTSIDDKFRRHYAVKGGDPEESLGCISPKLPKSSKIA